MFVAVANGILSSAFSFSLSRMRSDTFIVLLRKKLNSNDQKVFFDKYSIELLISCRFRFFLLPDGLLNEEFVCRMICKTIVSSIIIVKSCSNTHHDEYSCLGKYLIMGVLDKNVDGHRGR